MASWATHIKRCHEVQLEKERIHKKYLKLLNQFGYKKPSKLNKGDLPNIFVSFYHSNKIHKYMLREIFSYINEYQYNFDENGIAYIGFNILDEWNLSETEFPSNYRSYREYYYHIKYMDIEEIRAFCGYDFSINKFIEYDLKTFYYKIVLENGHVVI